jgi:hypothetical protein
MNEQQQILVQRLIEGELSTQRFLKVGKPGCEPDKDKAAFEPEWEKHLYVPEDLDSFPRWGICGKDYLVLIDSDKRELYDYLSKVLPNTLEVTSPRHGIPHKYLIVCGKQVPNGVFHILGDLDEKGRKNKSGEVRAENQYLVAPGTTIRYKDLQSGEWKTGQYIVTNNVPIARMEHADFMAAIKPYMNPEDDSQKLTAEDIAHGVSTGERHNKASRYADHLIGHRKLDAETTLYELRRWDQELNNPPINDDEYLKRCVRDAISFLSKKTGISKEQLAIHGAIANPVKTRARAECLSPSEAVQVWQTKDLIEYVLNDLGKRVKHDRPVKLSVLAAGLSAFSKNPINLTLKGESSVGKTYNTIETLRYFPQETVWYMGGMSPKSLIHSYGILMNRNGEKIVYDETLTKPFRRGKTEDEYKTESAAYDDKLKKRREELKGCYTLVDLSHKVLVFLEAPDFHTFQMLLPILSHDKEEITYMFVDKTGQGQLQTKRVILKGWPATVFLTAKTKYMEEFNTRAFSATPENTTEKIKNANELTNRKASLPWEYQIKTPEFEVIESLVLNLQDKFDGGEVDVIPPFLNLYDLFPKDQPRDMRDFQHFTQFLATVTMLNYYQRLYIKEGNAKYVLVTLDDVKRALEVYHEIFETTRTGAEKRLLDFYHNTVKTRTSTDEKERVTVDTNPRWYLRPLTEEYNKTAKKKLSENSIRAMLERLDEIGYVDTEQDDIDKRKHLYVPLKKDDKEDDKLIPNPSKIDFGTVLEATLKKGFDLWLATITKKDAFYLDKNDSEVSIGPESLEGYVLSKIQVKHIIPKQNKIVIVANEDSEPKPESNPATVSKLETKAVQTNSEEAKT